MNQPRPLPTPEIYENIEALQLPDDTQGWHSTHPVFTRLINETRPKTIIECGSWKGASIINMARIAPEAKLYAVDTWLGGIDHELNQQVATSVLQRDHGYPRLYFQFLANIKRAGVHDRVTPIPQTSINGARLLQAHGITAELIYIDGSHEAFDPYYDMLAYWPLVAPGGILFGDDMGFSGVAVSYYRFLMDLGLITSVEIIDGNFWVVRKK
jgi:predicted O-methyltransferase YrrM